jgi:hypothetical protein
LIFTALTENGPDVGDGIELETEAKSQSDPNGIDSAQGERGDLGRAHLRTTGLHGAPVLLVPGNVPSPTRKSQSDPDFSFVRTVEDPVRRARGAGVIPV